MMILYRRVLRLDMHSPLEFVVTSFGPSMVITTGAFPEQVPLPCSVYHFTFTEPSSEWNLFSFLYLLYLVLLD